MEARRQHLRVGVSEHPLDPTALLAEVGRPAAGAVAMFLGTARDHASGKSGITHLEYEAYTGAVEAKLRMMVEEAADKWPLIAAVVEHRVGRVEVGEVSVAVVVSSAHRAEAFEAARHLIEELKARAPIWKKEHWPGGAEWVLGA